MIREATLHKNFRARAQQATIFLRGHVDRKFPRSSHSISDISKTDKSNCCPHDILFHGATCGFKRLDAVNYALISGVGKTLLLFDHDDRQRFLEVAACKCINTILSNLTEPNILSKLRNWLSPSSSSQLFPHDRWPCDPPQVVPMESLQLASLHLEVISCSVHCHNMIPRKTKIFNGTDKK